MSTPDRDELARRGRIGGYAKSANADPVELSEQNRRAVNMRWERERQRRADAGLAPVKSTPKPLDGETLAHWLEVVDERFGVDYPWPNRMARKRKAVALARAEAARLAREAFLLAERRKK